MKNIRFIPGEHDAGLDQGKAHKEFFGETHYAFDYKGVHFIALDNVSDPTSSLEAHNSIGQALTLRNKKKTRQSWFLGITPCTTCIQIRAGTHVTGLRGLSCPRPVQKQRSFMDTSIRHITAIPGTLLTMPPRL